MPNIQRRITSFKNSLGKLVSCGLARGHRSNPAASIRIMGIYSTPVLMSGLGSLVLSAKENAIIDQQFKRTLQSLLKLPTNTSPCMVYFISGCLPATALLHLRYLSLFGMICRLKEDPLHAHALQVFHTTILSRNSWFMKIRVLLILYKLPHPLILLNSPPSKENFKKLVKLRVLDYWNITFRGEASFLLSAPYFQPSRMSLCSPHKLLTTAGSNPYEVAKARIQLQFLCSQYRSAKLTRHWSPSNPLGICTSPPCWQSSVVESNEHILLHCPAYHATRLSTVLLVTKLNNQVSRTLVSSILLSSSQQTMMQLLLDCTALPEVVLAAQEWGQDIYSDLFYFSRTWCFSIHRERQKRLCQWNFK